MKRLGWCCNWLGRSCGAAAAAVRAAAVATAVSVARSLSSLNPIATFVDPTAIFARLDLIAAPVASRKAVTSL